MDSTAELFKFPVPTIDLFAVAPIVTVILTGIIALVVEMLRPRKNNNLIVVVTLIGLVLAGVGIVAQLPTVAGPEAKFAGLYMSDRFGLIIQALLVMACALAVLFSESYLREKRIPHGEFYPMVLWSTAGGMIMSTSTNLLTIFLGLEILSISLYVLAGMSRKEERSEESALKYLLLGAFASGFLLYGIAFFYGATGSLDLQRVAFAWQEGAVFTRNLLLFGMGLLLIGLGFKAAFVPFHQWTPDVYQGAPTNVTAFMAAGSKIAAIAVLFRVLEATEVMQNLWMPALTVIAILTMTVGNLVALVQKDVKRVLGYSSIAHAGYILVAILAHMKEPAASSFGTVSYYLLSYSLMTIGAFAVISLVAKGGREGTQFSDLHGLWQRSPMAAVALIVFVASLIGIPPTAGFFGKLYIFSDAVGAGMVLLAVALAVNSVISIYYYLGIARAAFVSEEGADRTVSARMSAGVTATCLICAVGLIAAAIFTSPVTRWMVGEDAEAPPVVARR